MILLTVMAGSTRTCSPEPSVLTRRCLSVICSAIRGEMFDLKTPVPRPMTMMAITSTPYDAEEFEMTEGMAQMMRRMCPMMAIPMATQIVLNRPQTASAK